MVTDGAVLDAVACKVAAPAVDREGEAALAAVDMVVCEVALAFVCADATRLVVEYSDYTSFSPA